MRVRKSLISVAGTTISMQLIPEVQSPALLPLGRNTVLQLLLEEVISAGAEEIRILVNPDDQAVRRSVQALRDDGLNANGNGHRKPDQYALTDLDCLSQEPDCSLGAQLLAVRSFVGDEPFILATTDAPICHYGRSGSLLRRMCTVFDATGGDGVVAVRSCSTQDIWPQTVAESLGDTDGPHFVVSNLINSVNRPTPRREPGRMGLVERYVLSPIIFDYLDEQDTEMEEAPDLLVALRRLAQSRQALWAVRMHDQEVCFQLNSFLGYSRAFINFSMQDAEVGLAVREYISDIAVR